MLIGVIADDFTGASDIANTLAKGVAPEGGLRTAQFAGVPDAPAPTDIDAGVISLKSRTAPVEDAVAESLAALGWLQAQGCLQIIFKYCSTFDSTREGNIGPVATALANELRAHCVIFCPAFPTAGRTIYQGHLFVGNQPLNESGMQDHPLTPMVDADIRRWLACQTDESVGHLPYNAVLQGAQEIKAALSKSPDRFVIADAVTDVDLLELGRALADAPLITGGSGIAMGLPRNLIHSNNAVAAKPEPTAIDGPEAILAGSCSGATRAQIAAHADTHPALALEVPEIMAGTTSAADLVTFFVDNIGKAPLAYSSGTPDEVKVLQERFGRDAVASRLDALFAETSVALISKGFRRLVVAGGETSGAVAQAVSTALSAPAMTIGPEIDPGVPVLTLSGDATVAMALKSGNFGGPDFFAKALSYMAKGHP